MMRKILFAKPSITEKEISYVTDAVTNGWAEDCYNYLNAFRDKLKDYFGHSKCDPNSYTETYGVHKE